LVFSSAALSIFRPRDVVINAGRLQCGMLFLALGVDHQTVPSKGRGIEQVYVIRMKNCAFFAHHGVLDEEERLGQRFYLDAELEVGLHDAIEADSIDETVDYGIAFLEIEKVVRGRRRFLIEALALDVAKTLCRRFSLVRRARITVRKPNAPVPGVLDYVEVTVAWPQ